MKTFNSTAYFVFLSSLSALSAQNWQPMAVGVLPPNQGIYAVSAIGDNIVWATASGDFNVIPATHTPWILRTSDGGQTWVAHPVTPAAGTISFQIVAVDSLTAWITTNDYGGGGGRALYKTMDGGVTWAKKLNHPSGGVALNRFADGQHWFAQNRQANSQSSDDGESWNSTTITGYQTNEYQILYAGCNLSNTVGDTVWSGTNAGRIVRFTGYGTNHQFFNTNLGNTTEVSSIAFQDHLHGLCYSRNAAYNHRIARSMDGGATWSILAQQPGNTTGWTIAAVPDWPGFYVLASHYGYPGKVAITTNFGDSWSVENVDHIFNGVVFTSPSTGWTGASWIASESEPAIYKYNGSPLVSTGVPTEWTGFSVFPNPVSDILYFDLDAVAAGSPVAATLTDLAGLPVFSGKIADGQLNVSHLPAGLYFLKIETPQGTALRKIVRQ